MFLTLVYLKNKSKKKKKTNFIYKIKLKPRIMERGETYGEQGKRLGQSQYHILNTGSQGTEVLVSSGKSGGWNSVHWQTAQQRELAGTDSIPPKATGNPFPKNLLL